jgi:hypothetical protein
MLRSKEARIWKCKGDNVPFFELLKDVTQRRQARSLHIHVLMCVWRPDSLRARAKRMQVF